MNDLRAIRLDSIAHASRSAARPDSGETLREGSRRDPSPAPTWIVEQDLGYVQSGTF
jgi:hypothetical protein